MMADFLYVVSGRNDSSWTNGHGAPPQSLSPYPLRFYQPLQTSTFCNGHCMRVTDVSRFRVSFSLDPSLVYQADISSVYQRVPHLLPTPDRASSHLSHSTGECAARDVTGSTQ